MDSIRIFVASPSDVEIERASLGRIVQDINLTARSVAPEKGLQLELLRWETHVYPAMGDGPQGVIDDQIGSYDILVGIMWSASRSRGSSGLGSEVRIPSSEDFIQLFIQDFRSCL